MRKYRGTTKNISVNGWPAFFLCIIPMLIGWGWILNALFRAAL